jgi:hypothetical protein
MLTVNPIVAELLYRRVGIAHQNYPNSTIKVGNAHLTGILLESSIAIRQLVSTAISFGWYLKALQ